MPATHTSSWTSPAPRSKPRSSSSRTVAALLARDLAQHFPFQPLASSYPTPEHIALGTATDPYQPAERQFGVARSILEQLAGREGLSLSITTKSNLVLRDLDLLQRIAARSALSINITVTTLRPRLARLLEAELRLRVKDAERNAGRASAGIVTAEEAKDEKCDLCQSFHD